MVTGKTLLVLETPVKGKAGDIIRVINSSRSIINEGLQTGDFTQYLEDPPLALCESGCVWAYAG